MLTRHFRWWLTLATFIGLYAGVQVYAQLQPPVLIYGAVSGGGGNTFRPVLVDSTGAVITSGGGLTQNSVTVGQSGTLVMAAGTALAPSYTEGRTNALSMDLLGNLRVVGSGLGGTSAIDDADFFDGVSVFTLMGCVAESVSPTTVTEGDMGACAMTVNRAIKMVQVNAAGDFLVPGNDYQENTVVVDGNTGPAGLTLRQDAPTASSAAATNRWALQTTNAYGAMWTSQVDPCSSEVKTTTEFSTTTSAVLIAAAASKKNYICSIISVLGTADILNIWEGTGTKCATSSAALAGSTTAANGLSFAANGGFIGVGGNSSVIAGRGTNVDTCIVQSGSGRVAGSVTWVQR